MNITPAFHTAIIEQLQLPFEFGKNDCALFVNEIYKKAFDMDLAGDIVGTYDDEYHAIKTLVRLGNWDGILLPKGFVKLDNKNFVQRGDIVISENAAGIWVDNKAAFAGGAYRKLDQIHTVYKFKGL